MAKKRHHQSVRSRENEAAGEARSAERRRMRSGESDRVRRYEIGEAQMPKHGEFYGQNIGARPMKERHKSMISDDRSAPCNLPQHVMEKYWPVSHEYNMGYVDDLFQGVNKQLHEDNGDMRREMGPKKY